MWDQGTSLEWGSRSTVGKCTNLESKCPTVVGSYAAGSITYSLCKNLGLLLRPSLSFLICKRDIMIIATS